MRVLFFLASLFPLWLGATAYAKLALLPDNEKIALLDMVIRHQNLVFTAEHIGCEAGETLGHYLATLLVNSSIGDKHRLDISCADYHSEHSLLAPPTNPLAQDCRISAFSSDKAGESPWHYELLFRVDGNKDLDIGALACPGAS